MSVTPSIDYTCPHCGAKTTYQLVPTAASEPRPTSESGQIPSLDFSCARCGASGTYTLGPTATSD
jgi:rRNA maturation protein Nop10